ncbi:calcium-binding protein [Microvirga sp. BSC39]|uniref:calcium-binding protein n=1 Tax=Microvirga sp. BSC39 TaxID=1549810 RepID=UPI00068ED390|nr:calcium-binding protein [Microvirga sp. BSC39]
MPTVIAIEAKPVEFEGIDTGFVHLYLVKTVTDDQGRVISEKVIRGTAGSNGDLETLVDANLATSPDRRGSDTLEERHREVLDLGTRDANDVWKIMVQHANNIEKADLDYSIDIFREAPGGDLNSNSVVASVLHSVGLNLTTSFPDGVSRSDAPLYGQLQFMAVDDALFGTSNNDRVMGGVGNDRLYGREGNDGLYGENGNDRLYGSFGDDVLSGGNGNDRLYGESGADILRSGLGQDAFVYNSIPNSQAGVDTIEDFSVAHDTFWLNNRKFTGLGGDGTLKSSAFWTGTQAHDATDRVIYDRANGVLYYDQDGTGATEQVMVAKLSTGLRMSNLDILVI